ncbi:type 1 glutamine amidotransferase domain-containing protein [Couchioplanes caeruleus]|uniref:Thiamine biosynthesis protein ThiJ n=2 Tax=Couchioplanes caeruleus TaxID=56438 RepID=A0A1K0FCH7_9ACTN|nr:type 1 glutamine amidotransferase domain-containing protein [Couchioplanes caeruleus]OJF10529.1 thiamine biosynthesis protein ThiJ [Couchioplanes caeruleus subsp. caeruleus]ROP28625.1 putative intracellular protease/amidase [Couchioplanes caeruleus]
MSQVLFVMTGADRLTLADGAAHPTGFWAEEFLAPYRAVTAAGHEVVVATPGGVQPPVDRASVDSEDVEVQLLSIGALKDPVRLEDVDPARYAAVYYPGGHGPMEDLAQNPASADVIRATMAAGRPLAVVCHGVAALLATAQADGAWPFAGYRLTAFSNVEEEAAGLAGKLPWLLEDRLTGLGARFSAGEPWASHVVVDRNLYSGQNPGSSQELAAAFVTALR